LNHYRRPLNQRGRRMAVGTLTYKVTVKPRMKWVLIIAALLNWDWLTDKCLTSELVVGDAVDL
ncbi:hypothetical protein NFB76_17005, partial [Yersinia ruckeri]